MTVVVKYVNGYNWVRKDHIPVRIPDESFNEIVRYIYLIKFNDIPYPTYAHQTDSYKIGYTNNIQNRMAMLVNEKGMSAELVAYGYSKNHSMSEKYLIDKFKKSCVSYECFNLSDGLDVKHVISEMKHVCYNVTIFDEPRPECVCIRGVFTDTIDKCNV